MMRILFIHQNFPGQFKFLAPELVQQGHQVMGMTLQKTTSTHWQGVGLVSYTVQRGTTPGVHPWVSDFETKTIVVVILIDSYFNHNLGIKQDSKLDQGPFQGS